MAGVPPAGVTPPWRSGLAPTARAVEKASGAAPQRPTARAVAAPSHAAGATPIRTAAKRQAGPSVRAWTECLEGDIERVRAEAAGARAADTLQARRRQRVVIADTPEVQPIEAVHLDDESGASSGDEGPAAPGKSSGRGSGSATHGESYGGASGAAGSSGAAPDWEERAWAAWHQEHRWRFVNGRWYWRPVGQGPDGGSECPRAADPARIARNKARKEQKERRRAERLEREAQDPESAGADAWSRVYERQVNQRVHEFRQASWHERWG